MDGSISEYCNPLCVIEDGTIDKVITSKLEEARVRNTILGSVLPFQSDTNPTRRFFQWYQLPEPWTAILFEAYARQRGVNVFCGEKFAVGNQSIGQYVRLAITNPETRQDLTVALTILKDILQTGYMNIEGIN